MAAEDCHIEEFLASNPRIQCSVHTVGAERLTCKREMNRVVTAFYKAAVQ